MKALFLIALCFAAVSVQALRATTKDADADRVKSLPGFPGELPSAMYAGYINVDKSNRHMFYAFTESQYKPEEQPLVLWLTGGPGCSSLMALFTEHGMFNMDFNADGAGIVKNRWSWNHISNVLFLESPAGVGFSYSDNATDYTTGDHRTAEDSYHFLQGFLDRFPQYRKNEFWVTGESYAGHYIPELVSTILNHNKEVPEHRRINIKGLMAGNPWTDPEAEAFKVTENWWDRTMISEKVHDDINKYCSYRNITHWIINNVTATLYSGKPSANKKLVSDPCFAALSEGSLKQFGQVDILEVYGDVCNKGTLGNITDQPNWCATSQMTKYLNREDVQKALHVRNAPVSWAPCSTVVHYNQEDTQTSVLHHYRRFLAEGNLRILIYSGDNDAIVPTIGTRHWIKKLNLPIIRDVHEWYSDTNGRQVGGWAIQYKGLSFTSVRAAGHMVPFMQPRRAFHMFHVFLYGGEL